MPQTVKWLLRNYGVSITLLSIFTVVVIFHGLLMRAAILQEARSVDSMTAALLVQNKTNERIAEISKMATEAIVAGNVQAKDNYHLIEENNRLLQTLHIQGK